MVELAIIAIIEWISMLTLLKWLPMQIFDNFFHCFQRLAFVLSIHSDHFSMIELEINQMFAPCDLIVAEYSIIVVHHVGDCFVL